MDYLFEGLMLRDLILQMVIHYFLPFIFKKFKSIKFIYKLKTTMKQLLANRQNSLLSTGPKSEAGKTKASENSIKHGLFSKKLHLNPEDTIEFNEFTAALSLEFDPKSEIEKLLLDRFIVTSWRLGKVLEIDANLMSKGDDYFNNTVEARFQDRRHGFELLIRYETMLERQLYYCLNQLQQAKKVVV